MQIPKEARRMARELFEAALDDSGRPDSTKALSIADLVIKSAPRHALQILKEYTRLIRLETGKHHAIIESSAAIDDSTRSAILKSLQRRDGGEVSLEIKVDPSLIGGSRIRLGSEVWDATVASRLNALAS
jgi:F-type H+-transporting ATPase subunit delta